MCVLFFIDVFVLCCVIDVVFCDVEIVCVCYECCVVCEFVFEGVVCDVCDVGVVVVCVCVFDVGEFFE